MDQASVRSRQLQIVQRDASGAASGAESGPTTYKFRANDAGFDRYQDRNSVKGWKLENFNANPVILFNHDDGTGGFLGIGAKTLPIGKGKAYVEGDALMVDIEFDQNDPFAKQVESKVAGGYLNAVSVRYMLADGKYRENDAGGIDSDEQELLEISVVTLPGNQRAVRAKEFADSGLVELIASAVATHIAPVPAAVVPPAAPIVAEPAPKSAPPIDPTELSRLVAEHFTKSKES